MNIPKPPKDQLLESERKDLYIRITNYVGGIFSYMRKNAVPKWSATEIANKYGLQNSNISMIQNHKKYKREISSNELTNLLMEGLVTVKQLTDSCAKSDKEKRYLEERYKGIQMLKLAEKKGYDGAKIIEEFLKSKGEDLTDE